METPSKTLEELRADRIKAVKGLKEFGVPIESGINIKENSVDLYVKDYDRLKSAISAAGVELPDGVELIAMEEHSRPATDIYGGLGVSTCTLGFAVEDRSGTKGVTTAGHCKNKQSYEGTDTNSG